MKSSIKKELFCLVLVIAVFVGINTFANKPLKPMADEVWPESVDQTIINS